ncbi:MAG: hypothetical protein ACOC1K_01055 [Nanoarchaeota archaeon]
MDAKRFLEELSKPSKGEELLKKLEHSEEKIKKSQKDQEKKNNGYAGIIRDGVEVVDVKVVPNRDKPKLDKFGIPIPKNRKSWDKI